MTIEELKIIAIGLIIGLVGIVLTMKISGMGDLKIAADEAIQQCEQNLPRNQHCEPVISARVVDEE